MMHLLRRPISRILHLCVSFHEFAPSKSRPIPSPDLLRHKDWLSPPEVIRIFQTLKDPNSALPLLAQLSTRKDYNPNESLYATIIHKLALANNFDSIEALMQQIKADRKCRLSDAFFRNLIKIYGHSAGRINAAVETLFAMPDYKCWPSVATFNTVLNLLVTTKQFEVVHEVYVGAAKLGVEIDACCLNIIIKGLCESGQIEAALKVLDEFPQQRCSPTARTFSTIMHALCGRGRVEDSFGLLERMEAEGVEADAVVFNVLISGLRKRGRAAEGVELLQKMMRRGCDPNPGTYQEVLYCLLDSNKYSEAKKMMEKMMGKGINPSFQSYKLVIQGFCGDKGVEDVEWALRHMLAHGFLPKMGMWNTMLHCLLSHNHSNSLFSQIIQN
ncbi:pentatricopeptide repeat-containing protein At3g14580, mitochondrial [Salvia miltiorrhiza]|uniref:pentatricopeptide repeat-containing protein At3g14580, mitochondrial n=1 Tax=Salvia miltiorrhiza TaxID=226208 RepID=UPI0025AB9597|nr:pentatricopeptide repeat-containing protein At3g14580, mitochondrial [Salvia miltiorrhiza]